ncbi:MAG TPA: amino acid adenylation domain-containing protein [Candidatus Angelobacter sp.]|nr:amino acid adenylation domain-containing protein [Candidatus Angelobacter sp.]
MSGRDEKPPILPEGSAKEWSSGRFWIEQSRILDPDQSNPGTLKHGSTFMFRISGDLNVSFLEQSFKRTIEQSEIFGTNGSDETANTSPVSPFSFLFTDLTHLNSEEQDRVLGEQMRGLAQKSFTSSVGLGLRAEVWRAAPAEHMLLLAWHNLEAQGALCNESVVMLLRHVMEIYDAIVRGISLSSVQTAWPRQNEWLSREALEARLRYWREHLMSDSPVIEFPHDYPPSAAFAGSTAQHLIAIPLHVSSRLDLLAEKWEVPLGHLLLASVGALLFHYSGQQDIVIAAAVSAHKGELEDTYGLFSSMLPIPMEADRAPLFPGFAAVVHRDILGAVEHCLPLEILENSHGSNDSYQQPRIAFEFDDCHAGNLSPHRFGNLKLSYEQSARGFTAYDVTFHFKHKESQLTLALEFRSDLFSGETIARIGRHTLTLIASIAENPEQRLRDLQLMDHDEQELLLRKWNATGRSYQAVCMHQLFEAAVEKFPARLAVVDGKDRFTYEALNQRANQLARELVQRGIGPESLVGICVERSASMIVGLFGILKAGAAYVPIDPAYPSERIAYTLADARIQLLISQKDLLDKLPGLSIPVLCLDKDWPLIAAQEASEVASQVTSGNLAYVLYTSGSTGRPKGVAVQHRSVVNLLLASAELYAPEEFEGALAATSVCFDLSISELYVPLIMGGCLIVVQDLFALVRSPVPDKVTEITTVPSAITELLRLDELPHSVCTLNLAGEPLTEKLLRDLQSRPGLKKIINLYGPTETTDYSTTVVFHAGGEDKPSIGRPIANTQIYILGSEGVPAPLGVSGELCIGGDGLARGYLHRPELTAARFVPDPFSSRPGDRMYRTGDLARYLPDGRIELLGRSDHQVKIRGFRIEIGEVESALLRHPGVHQAVVAALPDANGDKRLVGYVVPASRQLSMQELREFLTGILPKHMVPAVFVLLETLPSTPNGKVDRQALPNPAISDGNYVAPRTSTEQQVAKIWAEVLGHSKIGIEDDFFELGGHSLNATQLVSRVRKIFGIELSLARIFEVPTVAELAKDVDERVLQDRALAPPPLIARRKDHLLPMSFAQQRMWFIDHLENGGSMYNMPAALRIAGKLDCNALERTFSEIIRRHEILRTTFTLLAGVPVQRVTPFSEMPLQVSKRGGAAGENLETEAQRWIREEAYRAFDLENGPVFRYSVLQLQPDLHVLAVNMHHIVSDGWSTTILMLEMKALYEAFSLGRPSPLADLPIQYCDYAIWQREWLQGGVLSRQLVFWKEHLRDAPAVLELPTDHPRPKVRTSRGDLFRFQISPQITHSLYELCAREGATLFMSLAAAFQVLLSRYTSQLDICIGFPIANRNRSEIENLIGFFVNTIVLRTKLDGNPSFSELLSRVRATALDIHAHQDLPFEQLVDHLKLDRTLAHTPLIQVVFAFQNAGSGFEEAFDLAPGVRVEPVPTGFSSAKFDLTFSVRESKNTLQCSLEYNADLFDISTIERMKDHFTGLLGAIVATPGESISRLDMLGAAEKKMLTAWGSGSPDWTTDTGLAELFAEQASRYPERLAASYEDKNLSYGELNQRSNQLARYLRARGSGPEVLVGVCLERSLELVVALLGIIKAGAAYVPIDPEYPAKRINYMLQDAGIALLVTQQRLLDRLPHLGVESVCLDTEWDVIGAERPQDLNILIQPESVAYVIYTSGSTGNPKGVMVNHRNVVRLMRATHAWYEFGSDDVWTLFHSTAFDFSVWEIWGALAYGGRLVVVPFWVSRSPDAFADLLGDEQVTVLNQTPSAFRLLTTADRAAKRDLSALRVVIFGGEALEWASLEDWIENHGLIRPALVNMYGITETTVHVTYHPIEAKDAGQWGASIIGRGIPDLRTYVLDTEMALAGVGIRGELYVGGEGVARGYLHRKDLTAQRFVPDPLSTGPGQRLYRTGDICRWREDGNLEYLGRIDEQVKIRGFRIELREVESALRKQPGVMDAVVVVWDSRPGDKRLVAYFIGNSAETTTPAELRNGLSSLLPEYMVPAHLVRLEEFPTTPSGKLARQALPRPETGRGERDEYLEPRNETERILAEIWQQVLRVERVGIRDNFFDLGGDSILSIRVRSQARTFGLEFTIKNLFECQNIADLAEITQRASGAQEVRVKPFSLIDPAEQATLGNGIEDAYPLSQLQAGMLFHSEMDPQSPVYHDISSCRLQHRFDLSAFQSALKELVAAQATLRTSFELRRFSQPLQLVHRHATVPVHVTDLRRLNAAAQEQELVDFVEQEKRNGFDWANAPLLRIYIHVLKDECFECAFSFHHAILDGWSLALLTIDLFRRYQASMSSAPLPLQTVKVSYGNYIALEQAARQSEAISEWWQTRLAGVEPAIIPRLEGDGAGLTSGIQKVAVDFVPGTAQGLKALSRELGLPIKSLLLGAHLKALSVITGKENVLTGLVTNGRPEIAGGEELLGLFLNTLPLAQVINTGSWAELAEAAFRAERELLEYRRYPLTEIKRSVGWLTLETVFNFTNLHVYRELEQSGVVILEQRLFEQTNFPFIVQCGLLPRSGELYVSVEVDRAQIGAEQAHAIAEIYSLVVHELLRDPRGRHDVKVYLPDDQLQRITDSFSVTPGLAQVNSLPQWFEQQVELHPHHVAVVCGDEELTYIALNQRANQLAACLREQGVRQESLVGVCLERSLDLIVALLGIVKAGAAYVPLDVNYPTERLAWMMEDTGLAMLVTTARLKELLPSSNLQPMQTICLDEAAEIISGHSPENVESGSSLDHLIYIMYTSGSTGKPRGVAVCQRGVVSLVLESDYVHLGPDEVILQMAPVSFDASTFEIWGALLNGSRLVIMEPGSPTIDEIGFALQRHGVTTLWLTAPLFQLMVEDRKEYLQKLQQLLAGGDALSPAHVERYLEMESGTLINGYGPTECTTFSCCARLRKADAVRKRVPIGRPIANRRAWVLDASLRPVPIGTPGELCLGGAGLARGYLGKPELTAEKFVPDAFSGVPGARLYRTGDAARFLADQEIDFLGRLDRQVKVRGFRVEPGEIEAALRRHGQVRDAAVIPWTDGHGTDKRLVAYIVGTPDKRELESHLRQSLPEYMIPSLWMHLEKLPLTPVGKLDKNALPTPYSDGHDENVALYVGPRTETERTLAGIWRQILGLERTGIHDNFFDNGGDSILLTRVAARVRAVCDVELPLRELFNTPTIAELARTVDGLRSARVGIVAPPITPASRSSFLPLSFPQERLWFLNQLEINSTAYNVPLAYRFLGPLHVRAFERAWDEVIRRHEMLRTSFLECEGNIGQIIAPHKSFSLEVVDLSDAGPETAGKIAQQKIIEASLHVFDLTCGPLFRLRLLRLSNDDHILSFTIHHIIFDGWSIGVLLRELALFYSHFLRSELLHMAELPIQYADFSCWQRSWIQGEQLDCELVYWKKQLQNLPAQLALPVDHPRPPVRTSRGATFTFMVGPAVVTALQAIGRRAGATLFMTLLAAFKSLLARYSGQSDIVVGTSIANRTSVETQDLIGFFVNLLVLRTSLADQPPYKDVLRRVRETCLQAYAHQHLPFELLVDEIRPDRHLDRTPLFQTLFVLQNAEDHQPKIPGFAQLEVRREDVEFTHAKFDLTLGVKESSDGLVCLLEYSLDLFEHSTIERMSGHLQNVLKIVASDPEIPFSQMSFITEPELENIYSYGRGRITRYPEDQGLASLFSGVAAKNPDRVALVFGDQHLSYAELNRRANRMAMHLRALGVGPEVLVGVCLERSLELVVAIMGIVKAGGAYVPLDISDPADRLAWLIKDCSLDLLVTSTPLRSRIPLTRLPSIEIVCVDADIPDAQTSHDISVGAGPENLAYVIYTSGSTGEPKGVAVRQRGVVRLVCECDYVEIGAEDVFLQMAPVTFDASTFEIWGVLLNGCRLAILEPGVPSLEEIGATLKRHGVTVLWLTASLFHLMVEERNDDLRDLKYLLAGGDVLSPAHVSRYLELRQGTLINGYGPTECTTFSCCATLRQWDSRSTKIPIGRPIANSDAWILDETFRPCPVGVPGELYLAGAGVGRGYIARPELTAEKFLPDVVSAERGGRMYRSGDRARYLADGSIEFLGRFDGQVKVRGYRIEPAEVEAALLRHGQLREAAVVALATAGSADKRMVAYFVGSLDEHELQDHLRNYLPEYMVPSLWVQMNSLPRTVSGKLDRRALPEPELVSHEGAGYLAPRTPVECALAEIWGQVLKVDRIGIRDNFFHLGGDSILSLRVRSQALARGIVFSIGDLFERQDIESLAQRVEKRSASSVSEKVEEESEPAFSLLSEADRLRLR